MTRPYRAASRRRLTILDSPYVFVLPAVLLFGTFTLYPILRSLYLSFFDYNFLRPDQMHWIGLGNYREIVQDERVTGWPGLVLPKRLAWWQYPLYPLLVAWLTINSPGGAFWNTVRFTVMYVPLAVVIPLLFAVLVERAGRLSTLFRTLNFIPVVVSVAVVSIIWMWIYHPEYGVANTLLRQYAGIREGYTWLSDPKLAMPSVVAMCVWHGLGFNMLLFLVGLQRIPPELAEAARVDGATGWQALVRITIPLLRPTIFLVGLLVMIGALKVFGQMFIMTQGGPADSTLSMVLYLYNIAFRYGKFRFGYASALAWGLAVFIFVVSVISFRLSKERA